MIFPYLTTTWCTRQLLVTFAISGLSKIADPKPLYDMFPALPRWFWPLAAVWEMIICAGLWYANGLFKREAYLMSFVYLGGVMFAVLVPKNLQGMTMTQKSYGLMLVPGTLTWLSTYALAAELPIPPVHAAIYTACGALVGSLVVNSNKRHSQ